MPTGVRGWRYGVAAFFIATRGYCVIYDRAPDLASDQGAFGGEISQTYITSASRPLPAAPAQRAARGQRLSSSCEGKRRRFRR